MLRWALMRLPRSGGDRLFQGLVALPMALFIGACTLLGLLHWKPQGWIEHLIKIFVLQTGFLFFFVFFLLLVWCAFTPAWIERLLERRSKQLMAFSAVLIIGLVLGLVVNETLRALGR